MGITLSNQLIDEFLLVKDAEGLSSSCHSKYEFNLKHFVSWLDNQEITKQKILEYLAYLRQKNLSDSYQKSIVATIKTFLNYLISEEYDVPPTDFKSPKVHKKKLCYINQDQIKKLLNSGLSPKEKLIIKLFLSTGLRLHELCMLNWEDVNFKTGVIAVNFAKGDKFRFVITDKQTLVLLMKYRNKQKIEDYSNPVFTHGFDERYTNMGMRSLINRAREKTGIYFTAHALRRSFARQCSINGMGIEFIQTLMGHESIEMTKHYIGQLDIEDVTDTYNKHKPLDI